MLRVLCALLMALLLMAPLTAQFKAGIQGSVLDPTGSSVPKGSIKLRNLETGQERSALTSEDGFYLFSGLAPGKYSISVEAPGFKRQVIENITVAAEQVLGVNIQLELGATAESVTVSAESAPRLQTEDASVAGVITNREIRALPQVGRDPFELIRLEPGVFGLGARNGAGNAVALPNSSGPGGSNSSIFQTENQVPISANGQRLTANSYSIDGVSVNSQAWGGASVVTPNQESVKEIRVVSSSYSAENGRNTGALIEVVSKNGTNQFHGSAFTKWNRPYFNAFQRWTGPNNEARQRVTRRLNQFGGSLGGPIVKNKVFFFFSSETYRSSNFTYTNQWGETPEFVSLVSRVRPNTIATKIMTFPGMPLDVISVTPRDCASVGLTGAQCRTVAGGLDLGSPAGTVGQLVTDPLGGGFDGIPDRRYVQTLNPSRNNPVQWNARTDYQATAKDSIAFSTYLVPSKTHSRIGGNRPALAFVSARVNSAATLLWTRALSASLVNEARFNVSRWRFNEIESNPDYPWGIPRINISAVPTPDFGLTFVNSGPGVFYQTTYHFRDSATKIINRHVIKFGGETARDQNNDTSAGSTRPQYTFNNVWSFVNDAPSTESGNFDPRSGFPTDLKKYVRAGYYAWFVQDDWKARPNLTVNLGLRWEYFTPLREKFGNLSNVLLGEGATRLATARVRIGGDLWNKDRNNFGPQFGFAWTPKTVAGLDLGSRVVLRGGIGIGYNRVPQSLTLNARRNPPFIGSFTLTGANILYTVGNDPALKQFYGWPSNPATILRIDPNTNIPIGGAPLSVQGIADELATPYTYRYSLETQVDVGHDWLVSAGYQGSTSHKFLRNVNYQLFFTPVNPAFNTVNFVLGDVNSNFNALLLRANRRFSKGVTFTAQYRWSKSLDTCSNDDSCRQSYPFDQRTERGPSDFDVTHAFVASGVWELPLFRTQTNWVRNAFGGWQVSGILTASSGFPWTAVYQAADCAVTLAGGGLCPLRPVAYSGGAGSDHSSSTFLKAGGNFPGGGLRYFVRPPGGSYAIPPTPGIGRNTFRGPRYFDVDAALAKQIRLTKVPGLGETPQLELGANFFNVFNKLNLSSFGFNSASTQINNVNFGRATSALGARVIEFQARLSF